MKCAGLLVAGACVGTAACGLSSVVLADDAYRGGGYFHYSGSVNGPYDWSGFYLGVNAGRGWVNDKNRPTCTDSAGVVNGPLCEIVPGSKMDSSSFIAGGQVGYNLQWQSLVVGIETDYQGADLRNSVVINGPFKFFGTPGTVGSTFSASERLNSLGTVRARLGVAVDRLLIYGTAGLAYSPLSLHSDLTLSGAGGFTFPASDQVLKLGWTVGGGIEMAVADSWTFKVEGLFFDLGSDTTHGTCIPTGLPGSCTPGVSGGFVRGNTFEIEGALFRVGLNYKFNDWHDLVPMK